MSTQIPVPLSVVAFDLAAAFTDVEVPAQARDVLAQLDRAGPVVQGYRVVETAAGRLVRLLLPEGLAATLAVPGLTAFELAVGIGDGGGLDILEPDTHVLYTELRNLRVALRFDPALLRPLDGSARAELVWSGALRCHRDWRLTLVGDPELTLSPCEIAGTGIVVELTGVQVDASSTSTPGPITALGLDAGFQGIYARSGSLRLLPQARFGGLAGLGVEVRDLAIGTSGVTGTVRSYFPLDDDSPDGANPLRGELFDGAWQLGIGAAEVDLRHNAVVRFSVDGLLRVPFFDTDFAVAFGMARAATGYRTTAALRSAGPIDVPVGPGRLRLAEFALDGELRDDGFRLAGTLRELDLDLDVMPITLGSADFAVTHGPGRDELRIELGPVELGPLGTVEHASLVCSDTTVDGERVREFAIEATVSWASLRARLTLPDGFPLPPDDGTVVARLRWKDTADADELVLALEAELDDVDALWSFVPVDWRPRNVHARFGIEAAFTSTTDDDLSGSVFVDVEFRLPDLTGLPGADLIAVTTGDATGLLTARLSVALDDAGTPSVRAELLDPLAIDVHIPGFAGPAAPFHAEVDRIALDLTAGEQASGEFVLEGAFAVRPFVPPVTAPFGEQLAALFRRVEIDPPVGEVAVRLGFADAAGELGITATLTSGGVDLDVFGMIADLARGIAPRAGVDGNAIDLDVDAGFDLKKVEFRLGSLEGGPDAEQIAFGLEMQMHLAGVRAEVRLELSDREVSIGVGALPILLRTPRFPLGPDDLTGLTTDRTWRARLDTIAAEVAAGTPDSPALDALLMRQFLLSAIYDVRARLGARANAQLYDALVGVTVQVMHEASDLLWIDTGLTLTIVEARFVIPLADPRGIRLEGTAALSGFPDDDQLASLNDTTFTLGLSAEMIYLSLRSVRPIDLPTIGHYTGGSVHLAELTIGYGYTKNSLAVVVNGELVLPEALVADLDTSEFGAGIRLPTHNRLGFKLDLVPVVLGPIDFVMPLIQFDIDLRKPGTPALVSTAPATPYWDGLQFIVPGVFRDAVKRIAFSPFFGPFPIPNLRFDGDLELGDESTGLTVIADEVLVLAGFGLGVFPPISIPMLADPAAPFFDNLCINVRFAGFGVNVNLQRPFPSLSPLALFETLGLISDPMLPIDPDGQLANALRVSLTDGVITLPPDVVRLFPDAAAVAGKTVDVSVNLGTVVTALQQTWLAIEAVGRTLDQAAQDVPRAVARLTTRPPKPDPVALLAMLPPELRRLRLGARLAGFDAAVVVLIVDGNDRAGRAAELERRGRPAEPSQPAFELDESPDPGELARFRPSLGGPSRPRRGRVFYPDDPAENLFGGAEFADFEPADIQAVPKRTILRRAPVAAVVVGARVTVFGTQRFRFLGVLYEDGAYSMVTAVDIEPLRLSVAGVPVELPFAASGRLTLAGRGGTGSVTATGWAFWTVLEKVLRVEVGSRRAPVKVEVHGDGAFAVRGDGRVVLWDGAVVIHGGVDVTDAHCLVEGSFTWRTPRRSSGQPRLLEMTIDARGRVGPGRRFELAGAGTLRVFGVELVDVECAVHERGASVRARVDTGQWQIAGRGDVECTINMGVRGEIALPDRDAPKALLTGEGSIELFGARVEGRGGVEVDGTQLTTYAEGSLRWHGREWLSGRVAIGTDTVTLSGHVAVGIALTPETLVGVELANLWFTLDVHAAIALTATGGLKRVRIDGRWALGARAAGTDQMFPLAAQQIHVNTSTLNVELISIDGFSLLPLGGLDGLTLPVPVFRPKRPMVELGHLFGVPGFRYGDIELGADLDDINAVEVAEIPVEFERQEEDLTLSFGLGSKFAVALVWDDGRLRLKVSRTGRTPTSIPI